MYQITVKYPVSKVDIAIEKLYLFDIYNVFYEAPIEVTTTEYGYGYYEKNNEIIDLKIVVETDNEEEVNRQLNIIKESLEVSEVTVTKIDIPSFETSFEPIDLNNDWIIAAPDYDAKDKSKINFIPQGAFGTGLHETTQDCLRFILEEDFNDKTVLDIGAGSGILSLAASIKGAKNVTALDIRDVKDEVEYNASLNGLNNIQVVVGDALNGEITLDKDFDCIFINIGGEELQGFMDFINSHLKEKGKLLISGLVEWSFYKVIDEVISYGYKVKDKKQSNEWCTALLDKE
ncbi:50S ribosomal protein L11 methyltransferase [Clostridium sp. A1-XYC3]|uniref:50S ribosomal protein L11 methyltransferase n=1 Tax=Clostridium tanneri TaxID=3037988 RepID=A0ABU4JTW8_9CLOT|nr:50S ribosomal protein L11 methyltransferase [Clostridium sp. A1-XYC3]MDW8801396.1 50S ribosomal protein L11 methyltransferase [Clostridium sp. A1-XYC3]